MGQEGFVDERTINLNSSTLQVQMTQEFIEQVRKQFEVPEGQPVNNAQVKAYLVGAVMNALNKIKKENVKEEQASDI